MSSAGTRAVISHPIHHEAALVLQNMGGDTSDFAARQLTRRIASDADLILTMTTDHRDTVLGIAPHKIHQTFTLTEASWLASERDAQTVADLGALRPQLAAYERHDIADPIGQSAEVFTTIGAQIAELLVPILELCQRSSAHPVD